MNDLKSYSFLDLEYKYFLWNYKLPESIWKVCSCLCFVEKLQHSIHPKNSVIIHTISTLSRAIGKNVLVVTCSIGRWQDRVPFRSTQWWRKNRPGQLAGCWWCRSTYVRISSNSGATLSHLLPSDLAPGNLWFENFDFQDSNLICSGT